eukprot:g23626.t1
MDLEGALTYFLSIGAGIEIRGCYISRDNISKVAPAPKDGARGSATLIESGAGIGKTATEGHNVDIDVGPEARDTTPTLVGLAQVV